MGEGVAGGHEVADEFVGEGDEDWLFGEGGFIEGYGGVEEEYAALVEMSEDERGLVTRELEECVCGGGG